MANTIIYLIALGFLGMGLAGIVRPRGILRLFSMSETTAEMRNEVRAVYGGFGIAIAVALFIATRLEGLRLGVLFTVALSLLGMGCGRLASLLVERPSRRLPYVFLVLEFALGFALCYSWWSY